ncbi:MAG: glycine cleavage system aminomethyltransferase GcvT [Chloroflexi bacterium]|nr:glycine cleavage system aminomethyltransferase GcvT [Chloroflexota bacterium]
MTKPLQKTNIHAWHAANGGRMVPFAGWEMPVQYPTGPLEEHKATRTVAGLFDIDHMGQMEVRGPQAEAFVNYLVTYDVRRMALNDAHYSLMCYPDGGVVDDIFIYKLADAVGDVYFFIAINAGNRHKDVQWASAQAASYDVTLTDVSDETYMLAFQGPQAPAILNRLTQANLESVPRFTALHDTLFGVPVLLGRTGYTGEDGFELYFPAEHAVTIWEGILQTGQADGVLPIGLAARDSLRFEPCMPLYGHELSPTISPVEARLTFAVSFDKPFIGRDALLKQKLEKPARVSVGIELLERGVIRETYPVYGNGRDVGVVTSGMFSPTTGRYLGMALVAAEFSAIGTELDVQVRDKLKKVKVVKRPFYTPAYR